jgi:hypothetical protein
MKYLMMTAAMAAAIGGAAFAQTGANSPTSADTPAATGPAPMGQAPVNPSVQASPSGTMSPPSEMAPAAPAAPAPTTSAAPNDATPSPMASNTTSTANSNAVDAAATIGAPPSSYPLCKTRHQDRCRVSHRR